MGGLLLVALGSKPSVGESLHAAATSLACPPSYGHPRVVLETRRLELLFKLGLVKGRVLVTPRARRCVIPNSPGFIDFVL
jgi:hypothetical protein